MRILRAVQAVVVPIAMLLVASPALASFHLMKVVEVFPGAPASPSAQYVVLQMYFAGQNFVGGHSVVVYDAAGTAIGTFSFTSSVANSATQAKILIATPQAATFFGLTPDLSMTPLIAATGGKVCFDAIDCVAFGTYSGSAMGVGTPFNDPISGGLAPARAARRRLDIAGFPGVLDGADDTGDSANDFRTALPAPANNANQLGVAPPSTCSNMVLEGLEQCDDGNLGNGDGCSSLCELEPPRPPQIFANGFE